MNPSQRPIQLYCIHGHAMALGSDLLLLDGELRQLIAAFGVQELPGGISCIEGHLRHYIESEVLRHLSTRAVRVETSEPYIELYQEADRFWLVDERWGISEVNFLRGQFKSFVLPHAVLDSMSLLEEALVWPMAQLLRQRGLHLVKGVSAVKEGFGVLVLCAGPIWAEVAGLVEAGYELVSQRWTGLRVDEGRVEMLHMPGPAMVNREGEWVELVEQHQRHAFCDAVILVDGSRRGEGEFNELKGPEAQRAIKSAWPMLEVHPSKRIGAMAGTLASLCRCGRVMMSREGGDLAYAAERMRDTGPGVIALGA